MNALNILFLTEMKDNKIFSEYENALSGRVEKKLTKDHERDSLEKLVLNLSSINLPTFLYDGFFFSFTISHIGKEFDLLKIASDKSQILNIELKSCPIDLEKIEKQLMQNQYYLGHISKQIYSFTFIASTSEMYFLDQNQVLQKTDINHLSSVFKNFTNYIDSEIENLFRAKDFLISPINTPDKFLNNHYFLTSQQEEYQKNILNTLTENQCYKFIDITGGPGTGKTLLLYDIARKLSLLGRVYLIHCGILSQGHTYLNTKLPNINIVSIRDINVCTVFSHYTYILIDEAQRIYHSQFNIITSQVKKNNLKCIFSYDSQQILSASEESRNVSLQIFSLSKATYKLSEKIRTNKELSSFILSMLNLNNETNKYNYSSIDILYAEDEYKALRILDYYKQNYTFINFTSSNRTPTSFDIYGGVLNTHKVIGQEFDNVLMILDNNFYYDENGVLRAYSHPNPDYLYLKLLFQGISRTRERLCLIIVNNIELFEKINKLKLNRLQ